MSEIFYVPPEGISGVQVTFPPGEEGHIHRTCRKGVGDRIRITDGRGSRMIVLLREEGKALRGEIVQAQRMPPPAYVLDLAVGVSNRERMSWLVEKGTEIGMTGLIPLITSWSRTQRHRGEWGGHLRRWKRVSISALKQSHRWYLPHIHPPRPLDDFLNGDQMADYDLRVLLDPGREGSPVRVLMKEGMRKFLLVAGPEGGFTEAELGQIIGKNFARGRLIDYPLRFETAGIAALSLVACWLQERGS